MYTKNKQLKGKKKLTRTQLNKKANEKLEKLKRDKDIRQCELCSTRATTNAHRHPRVWYYSRADELLWDFSQVLFLCSKCHQRMDDRSHTTEEEKEKIFKRLRCQE